MSVNTLHYSLPMDFTNRLKNNEGLLEAFSSIFGCGSSLKSFFSETDSDEIEEITEDLEEEDVKALKELLEQTTFGTFAFTENTFDVHIKGISCYFESKGYADAKELATSAINGDSEVYDLSIYAPSKVTQDRIVAALTNKSDDVFSMYELSGHYTDPEWKDAIKNELTDIISCYESAHEIGGEVWIGSL